MIDPDQFARALNELTYGHLPRRVCSKASPMQPADVDRYRWSHPDAQVIGAFPSANRVDVCRCPNCGLTFTSFPRPQ